MQSDALRCSRLTPPSQLVARGAWRCSFYVLCGHRFWSKYGQWGNREYYDAATATSPAAAAVGAPEPQNFASGLPASSKVHAYLDRLAGSRPACVAQNSAGRGLPPDSFLGPPAVWKPARGEGSIERKPQGR